MLVKVAFLFLPFVDCLHPKLQRVHAPAKGRSNGGKASCPDYLVGSSVIEFNNRCDDYDTTPHCKHYGWSNAGNYTMYCIEGNICDNDRSRFGNMYDGNFLSTLSSLPTGWNDGGKGVCWDGTSNGNTQDRFRQVMASCQVAWDKCVGIYDPNGTGDWRMIVELSNNEDFFVHVDDEANYPTSFNIDTGVRFIFKNCYTRGGSAATMSHSQAPSKNSAGNYRSCNACSLGSRPYSFSIDNDTHTCEHNLDCNRISYLKGRHNQAGYYTIEPFKSKFLEFYTEFDSSDYAVGMDCWSKDL